MKKNNKKDIKNNDVTKIMITTIIILLIFIGFLGINILIKSAETGEIDKVVDKIAEQEKNK